MQRFWSKVQVSDGCWLWTAVVNAGGYGQFRLDGVMAAAHRVSYRLTYGEFDPALHVLHKCDVRRCVRPDHLFLGTVTDNMRDCARKGRFGERRGERNANVKLTAADVAEIRRRYLPRVVTQDQLAAEFGVTQPMIGYIVRGANWVDA